MTRELVERMIDDTMEAIDQGDGGRWDDARQLFAEMALADDFEEFLTIPAYERMP